MRGGRSTLRDVYGGVPPDYDLHRGRTNMPDYRAPPAYDMHGMRGRSTMDDIENMEYARELMIRMNHTTMHDEPRGMPSARHARQNMYDMGTHREVMTRAASYVNDKVIEKDEEDNLETVAMKAIVMARKAVNAEKVAKDAAAEKLAAENALANAVKEDEEKNKSSKAEADAVAFVIATARKLQAAQEEDSEEEEEEEEDEREERPASHRAQIPLSRKDTRQADHPEVPFSRKDTRQSDRSKSAVPSKPSPERRGRSTKAHRSSDDNSNKNRKKGGFFQLFGGGQNNADKKQQPKVMTSRGKTVVKEPKRGTSKPAKRSQSLSAAVRNNSLTSSDDSALQKPSGRLHRKTSASSNTAGINLDDIPVISNWEHQQDGSITGNISNSPNYEDGTIITTAIVTGRIVVTESGHKYRLI